MSHVISFDFNSLPTSTADIQPSRHVKIASEGAILDAYLWLPTKASSTPLPIIVWGHGLGAVQYMGLTGIAQYYVTHMPVAVLTFDYRGFGKSTTSPGGIREYIDITGQKQDWRNVLHHIRTGQLGDKIDSKNISIGGSSFGGGMVLAIAAEAEQRDLRCVISQVPFVGMLESMSCISPIVQMKLLPYAVIDKFVVSLVGRDQLPAVRVQIAGRHGETALMSSKSSWTGFEGLTSPSIEHLYEYISNSKAYTPARFVFESLLYRPLWHSQKIKAKVLAVVATHDDLIPLWSSRRGLKSIPGVEYHEIDTGHFDVYPNCKAWQQNIKLQIDFLKRHLSL